MSDQYEDQRLSIDPGGRHAEIYAMDHSCSLTDTIVSATESKTVFYGDLLCLILSQRAFFPILQGGCYSIAEAAS